MHGPDQAAAVREIDALLPDLRRARISGDPDVLVRLAAAMYRYGYHCQHYEVLAWGYDAVPVAAHPRLPLALAAAATYAWGRGDLAVARELGDRALRAAPSAAGTHGAHEVLGDVALVGCDAPAALRHYRAMADAGLAAGQPAVQVVRAGRRGAGAGLVGGRRGGPGGAESAVDVALAVRQSERAGRGAVRAGRGARRPATRPGRWPNWPTAAELAAAVDDRLFARRRGDRRGGDRQPARRPGGRRWPISARCSACGGGPATTPCRANALRNLLVLLARVGADEAAALVDAALPAAALYPAEAARLDRARAAVGRAARRRAAGRPAPPRRPAHRRPRWWTRR